MYSKASALYGQYMHNWSAYMERHDNSDDEIKRKEFLTLALKMFGFAQITRRILVRARIAIAKNTFNYWGDDDKQFLKSTI